MRNTYTRELLQDVVQKSVSYAGVLRELGLKQAGGTQSYIIRKIKHYQIDTSHFSGQGHHKGNRSPKRKAASDILVRLSQNSNKQKTAQLVRALREIGREYKCSSEQCFVKDEWNGSKIVLQVDHIDGDTMNNLESNLRFLCPNCHSQTSTFCRQK